MAKRQGVNDLRKAISIADAALSSFAAMPLTANCNSNAGAKIDNFLNQERTSSVFPVGRPGLVEQRLDHPRQSQNAQRSARH